MIEKQSEVGHTWRYASCFLFENDITLTDFAVNSFSRKNVVAKCKGKHIADKDLVVLLRFFCHKIKLTLSHQRISIYNTQKKKPAKNSNFAIKLYY